MRLVTPAGSVYLMLQSGNGLQPSATATRAGLMQSTFYCAIASVSAMS